MAEPRRATPLEVAIRRATQGRVPTEVAVWSLYVATLFVLTPMTESGAPAPEGVQPLVLHREGKPFLAAFTHPDRVHPQFGEGRAVASLPGSVLLGAGAPEVGVVVNPATDIGFELPAEGLMAFRAVVQGPPPEEEGAAG